MNEKLKIIAIVGTRPNFMKTAPVVAALNRRPDFETTLIHTGQHYDAAMSDVFLRELSIDLPQVNLGVGSGTHSEQTAKVMEGLEPVLRAHEPDLVLVSGDVNSTLGAALTAAKIGIAVGHIEAGLRSFDRTMPEEINRVLTDAVSSFLFVHSDEAIDNLLREGARRESIHFVGNTMIDTLIAMRAAIDATQMPERLGLRERDYVVVTLHRPTLVDGPLLADTIDALVELARTTHVVFPVHPRTRLAMQKIRPPDDVERLRLIEPLGYLGFMSLVANAAGVITDSGGIQEETTFLGIPCFTLRDNTERPVTCTIGTNTLLGLDPTRIAEVGTLLGGGRPTHDVPPMWDGHAAERIALVLEQLLNEPQG